MRITSKGQVTIPQDIRERLGLLPNTEVEFEIDGDAVRLTKSTRPGRRSLGRDFVEHMRGRAGAINMTTDEIMRLLRPDD
jgi:AbrB family looped-hinge helix DNA binding protein